MGCEKNVKGERKKKCILRWVKRHEILKTKKLGEGGPTRRNPYEHQRVFLPLLQQQKVQPGNCILTNYRWAQVWVSCSRGFQDLYYPKTLQCRLQNNGKNKLNCYICIKQPRLFYTPRSRIRISAFSFLLSRIRISS